MRWLFLFVLVLNIFPSLFATNGQESQSAGRVSPQPASTSGGKALQLVSEVGPPQTKAETDQYRGPDLPEQRDLLCFVVGPLMSQPLSNTIGTALADKDYDVLSMWRDVEAGTDYLVYLPVQPSVRATSRLIQELSANNIDSFVVPEGELEGALAVGVFGLQAHADRQQAKLIDMGYDVGVESVQRWNREYWLLLEAVPGNQDWQAVVSQVDVGSIPQKMSRRSCKTVASAMRFQ
jgi:hypothetical protein